MPEININELDYSRDWKLRAVESGGTGWSSDWDPDNPYSEDDTYATELEKTVTVLNNMAFDKFNIPFNKNNTVDDIIHNIEAKTSMPSMDVFKWTPYINSTEYVLSNYTGSSVPEYMSVTTINDRHYVPPVYTETGKLLSANPTIPYEYKAGSTYVLEVLGYYYGYGNWNSIYVKEPGTGTNYGANFSNDVIGLFIVRLRVPVSKDTDKLTINHHSSFIHSITLKDYADGSVLGVWDSSNFTELYSNQTMSKNITDSDLVPNYLGAFDGTVPMVIEDIRKDSDHCVARVRDPWGNAIMLSADLSVNTQTQQLTIRVPVDHTLCYFGELREYQFNIQRFDILPQFKNVDVIKPSNLSKLDGDRSYYCHGKYITFNTLDIDVTPGNCVVFENCVFYCSLRSAEPPEHPIINIGKYSTVKFVNCSIIINTFKGTLYSEKSTCLWYQAFNNAGRCIFDHCMLESGMQQSFRMTPVIALSNKDTTDVFNRYSTICDSGIGAGGVQYGLFCLDNRGPDGDLSTMALFGGEQTTPGLWKTFYTDFMSSTDTRHEVTRVELEFSGGATGVGCSFLIAATPATDCVLGAANVPVILTQMEIPTGWTDSRVYSFDVPELGKVTESGSVNVGLCLYIHVPDGQIAEFAKVRYSYVRGGTTSSGTFTPKTSVCPISEDDTTVYERTMVVSQYSQ